MKALYLWIGANDNPQKIQSAICYDSALKSGFSQGKHLGKKRRVLGHRALKCGSVPRKRWGKRWKRPEFCLVYYQLKNQGPAFKCQEILGLQLLMPATDAPWDIPGVLLCVLYNRPKFCPSWTLTVQLHKLGSHIAVNQRALNVHVWALLLCSLAVWEIYIPLLG